MEIFIDKMKILWYILIILIFGQLHFYCVFFLLIFNFCFRDQFRIIKNMLLQKINNLLCVSAFSKEKNGGIGMMIIIFHLICLNPITNMTSKVSKY